MTRTALGAMLLAIATLGAGAAAGADVDEHLATAVHEALADDRRVDAQQVRVEATSDGVVRLEGEVDTREERDAAAEVARRVRGVSAVDNRLSVAPRGGPGTPPIPERPAR